MTEFYVPRHVRGRFATREQKAAAAAAKRDPSTVGTPYEFFRGIHHIPDAIADSHDANDLGIKPVEEMTDDEWRLLGLSRDAWMEARDAKLKAEADAAKTKADADKPKVAAPAPAPAPAPTAAKAS